MSERIYILLGCIYSVLFIANIYVFPFDNHHIIMAIPILKAGHFFGDLIGGIIHYVMDTYEFEMLKDIHYNFRNHHKNVLSMEDYSLIISLTELTPLSIPGILISLLISIYTNNIFISDINAILIISNIVNCSNQISHRMAHRRSYEKQYYVPYIVKVLQKYNIILNPKHHHQHHITETTHFCSSNGSASNFLDKIIKIFNMPVSIYNNAEGVHTRLDNQHKLL